MWNKKADTTVFHSTLDYYAAYLIVIAYSW